MLPIKDDIPTRSFPVVTVMLIAANVATFLYQSSLSPRRELEMALRFGLVPAVITSLPHLDPGTVAPSLLTFLTSMFLHGDILHLAGNMLFLWIFGNNVEDELGRFRFVFFYLCCGLIAALTQVAALPRSSIPMVGASGAIAGVLGAYFILFPTARILTLVPFFFVYLVRLPAFVVLGMWFLFQVIYSAMSATRPGGGVAWFAHIGGFVAGMILLTVFRRDRVARRPPSREDWV